MVCAFVCVMQAFCVNKAAPWIIAEDLHPDWHSWWQIVRPGANHLSGILWLARAQTTEGRDPDDTRTNNTLKRTLNDVVREGTGCSAPRLFFCVQKARELRQASSAAAEQRGAGSCVTYFGSLLQNAWDNNGLDWEKSVWMGGDI